MAFIPDTTISKPKTNARPYSYNVQLGDNYFVWTILDTGHMQGNLLLPTCWCMVFSISANPITMVSVMQDATREGIQL